MEFHLQALSHLCRVCPAFIKPGSKSVDAILFAKEIHAIWDINVWTDEADINPKQICNKCHRKALHCRNGTRTYATNPDFQIFQYRRHSRSGNCDTCLRYRKLQSGAIYLWNKCNKQPRTTSGITKANPVHLPFDLNASDIFYSLHTCTLQNGHDNYKFDIDSTVSNEQRHFFICPICMCILSNPLQGNCQHSFCSDCLTKLFQFHQDSTVSCPVCSESILFHSVKLSPNILILQLSSLPVKCHECSLKGPASELLRGHHCQTVVQCEATSSTIQTTSSTPTPLSPLSLATRTLTELAEAHTAGQPIPEKIKQVTDKWTWLRLKASKDRVIQLQTRGMVNTFFIFLFNFPVMYSTGIYNVFI